MATKKLALDIAHKARFQGNRRAVVESNKANRKILNRKLLAIVLTPRVEVLRIPAHFLVCHSACANWFGIAHQIKGQVQNMHADIDKRTAALLFLIDKHTPTRNAAPAKRHRTGVIDISHMPLVDEVLHK